MGNIHIDIDGETLWQLIRERDALRDRIHELEDKPLDFSLEKLARDVVDQQRCFTPDQRENVRDAIKRGGRPKPGTTKGD